MEIFRVRAFYELIVEEEFEIEADDETVALAAELWARERLRTLRVTGANGEVFALPPDSSSRRGLLDLDIETPSCPCEQT